MFFKQFISNHGSISYFFGCGSKGKALALDVVEGDEGVFITEAEKEQVAITHVVDTQIHARHRSGGRQLAARVGAPYCLHESNTGRTRYAFQALRDQEMLGCGNVDIEILHAPGCAPDGLSMLVMDRRRGADPWFILTGALLLVGAVGCPEGGNTAREMAGITYDSIHQRILSLPDFVEIYPGSRGGHSCGVAISGKPSSTVGFERRWNPLLNLSRSEFLERLMEGVSPPSPEEMDNIGFNLGEAS
jgi:glyoxylase-like metal-dependent hydrolase (beta-lactamase superfamily II)